MDKTEQLPSGRGIFQDIDAFSTKVGLPPGFYDALYDVDDWPFVIQITALVEAACTHALCARFYAPELVDELAVLELGRSKVGKIALLRRLGALTAGQAAALQCVYELRNILAHNISMVSFTFGQHLSSLDKQQREKFVSGIATGIKNPILIRGIKVAANTFVSDNPKVAIWITVAEIVACLYLEDDVAKVKLLQMAADVNSEKGRTV